MQSTALGSPRRLSTAAAGDPVFGVGAGSVHSNKSSPVMAEMLQLRVSEKSSNEEAQVHMRSCESLSVKVVFFHNGPAQTTRVKRQIWSSAATASVAAAEIKG